MNLKRAIVSLSAMLAVTISGSLSVMAVEVNLPVMPDEEISLPVIEGEDVSTPTMYEVGLDLPVSYDSQKDLPVMPEDESKSTDETDKYIDVVRSTNVGQINKVVTANSDIINNDIQRARDVFSVELFKQTSQGVGENENLAISSSAINMAMGLITEMAMDAAAVEINHIMSGGAETEQIGLYNRYYMNELSTSDKTNFESINAMWMDKSMAIKDYKLASDLKKAYNAKIGVVGFAGNRAASVINDWVDSNTEGKIKKAVSGTETNDTSFFMNISKFSGALNRPFDPNETRISTFYNADGSEVNNNYMYRDGNHLAIDNENEQGIVMHYSDAKHKIMIMSPKKLSVDEYINSMSLDHIKNLERNVKLRECSVLVPEFEVDNTIDISKFIQRSGVDEIFNNMGAFEGFVESSTSENMRIMSLNHSAGFSLNEYGTYVEAEDAPEIVGTKDSGTAIGYVAKYNININKPFVYVLIGDQGEIKFIGAIRNISGIEMPQFYGID